jgi:heterodisulfide reductase subunit C
MADERIAAIAREAGIDRCIECGRCTAVCPMAEMYANFSGAMSPRGLIKKALAGEDVAADPNLWYCTECNAGTDACPQQVSCRELVRGLRRLAVETIDPEAMGRCACCGDPFLAPPVEAFVFSRLSGEPPNVIEWLKLCPACRREGYLRRNA